MFRFVRKSADSVFDVAGGKTPETCPVTSGDELGQRGTGRDGCRASTNLEAASRDAPAVYQSGKPQDIPTDGV